MSQVGGGGAIDSLFSSDLTPLGQAVGADIHVLSRIQSYITLHRRKRRHHIEEEGERRRRDKGMDRPKSVSSEPRASASIAAICSFIEGTVGLTTGLTIVSLLSLLMSRKAAVQFKRVLEGLPVHARNAAALGVFMALYNGMVARSRTSCDGKAVDRSVFSSPFYRGFIATLLSLPLAERSGRYFTALFVICRACEVLTVLGYTNLPSKARTIIDTLCLGRPATAASLMVMTVGVGIVVDATIRRPETMDPKYRKFAGVQAMVDQDKLEAFFHRLGQKSNRGPELDHRYPTGKVSLCDLHHFKGADGCISSVVQFFLHSFTKLNMPLYAKLYLSTLVIALLKGERNYIKAATRFLKNVCRSSLFMTSQVALLHLVVCTATRLSSSESTLNSKYGPLIGGMLGGPAILIEKPQRRPEIAMFVMSHALHIILQRATIGVLLRRLLLLLAACGVGTLTYAFEMEESGSKDRGKPVSPTLLTDSANKLAPPPNSGFERNWPSSASLYSESEMSSEEYVDSSEPEGLLKGVSKDEGHHLLRPSYRAVLRWLLDTPATEHKLSLVGRVNH